MRAYSKVYLRDVVENQGKLFDYYARAYPDMDTGDFISAYMTGRTRKSADEGQAYVITMDYRELLDYFLENDNYIPRPGRAMTGFAPAWIGEFYAYYQWFYGVSSAEIIRKIPVDFLKKAYPGLHDLDLELAVEKAKAV